MHNVYPIVNSEIFSVLHSENISEVILRTQMSAKESHLKVYYESMTTCMLLDPHDIYLG